MRSKEDSADYRYFPDPDLPPLVIAPEWVERVKGEMPELPSVMAARFESVDGLPAYDATMMTQSLATARYYEAAKAAGATPKLVANWVMGEISKRLNASGAEIDTAPVGPELLAALIIRIKDGTISNNAAKEVFEFLWTASEAVGLSLDASYADRAIADLARVDAVIEAKGLKQVSDTGAIEAILDEVLATNQKSVDEYRAGKDKAFNALVGQAMKATKGKANPALVNELLKKKLG
jgi:aspartyl-tRNA(Asn)/glutamyl-tRNA(Gln) amidotransferase subunit B